MLITRRRAEQRRAEEQSRGAVQRRRAEQRRRGEGEGRIKYEAHLLSYTARNTLTPTSIS